MAITRYNQPSKQERDEMNPDNWEVVYNGSMEREWSKREQREPPAPANDVQARVEAHMDDPAKVYTVQGIAVELRKDGNPAAADAIRHSLNRMFDLGEVKRIKGHGHGPAQSKRQGGRAKQVGWMLST